MEREKREKKYKTERFSQLLHSYFVHFSTSTFLLLLFYGRIYISGWKKEFLSSFISSLQLLHSYFVHFSSSISSFSSSKKRISLFVSFFYACWSRKRERKKKERFATTVAFPHSSTLLHFSLSHPSKRNPSKRKTHSKRKKGNRSKSQGRKGRDEDARGDGKNRKRGRGEVKGSERKRDEARRTKAHGTSVSALDERRRDVERRGAAWKPRGDGVRVSLRPPVVATSSLRGDFCADSIRRFRIHREHRQCSARRIIEFYA